MSSIDASEIPIGWSVVDGKLHRAFQFVDFTEAFGFLTKVALAASAMNHHPEFYNVYNRVTIDLVTHDQGNTITAVDIALAEKINRFVA